MSPVFLEIGPGWEQVPGRAEWDSVPEPFLGVAAARGKEVLRAKALDDEIDRAFPLQGCSAGTLNASLSLASQTPSPPGERTRWAVCWSASPCLVQAGWSPLTDGETKSWGGGDTNSGPLSLQQGELRPTPGGLPCPGLLLQEASPDHSPQIPITFELFLGFSLCSQPAIRLHICFLICCQFL
ncbi:hypothetical protein CapIbe_004753 [Capra ibex]